MREKPTRKKQPHIQRRETQTRRKARHRTQMKKLSK